MLIDILFSNMLQTLRHNRKPLIIKNTSTATIPLRVTIVEKSFIIWKKKKNLIQYSNTIQLRKQI